MFMVPFPGEDFIQTGNYEDYIHSGEASAMMYFDMYSMAGDHDAAQDEWLVTPSIDNAAYLELYYYMDPRFWNMVLMTLSRIIII